MILVNEIDHVQVDGEYSTYDKGISDLMNILLNEYFVLISACEV